MQCDKKNQCSNSTRDDFERSSKESLLSVFTRMVNSATTVSDVYEALVYLSCFISHGTGAFLSTNGTTEYFDVVMGSYKQKRFGGKGGKKIWQYELPEKGDLRYTADVWVYKSMATGWVLGIDTLLKPDKDFIESLNLICIGGISFIRAHQFKITGIDHLTGLFNREKFDNDAKHLVDVFSRNSKPFTLFFIDINNFKAVNDTHGHDMGDRILQSQAFIITKLIGDSGSVYRYGGDEFCVLLPGIDEKVAEEIARNIEKATEQAPGGITVSASVGVAKLCSKEDVGSLVSRADMAMYERKTIIKEGYRR